MVIDGKQIAKTILDNLKSEVAALPFRPVFCDVLVGGDPASVSYVKIKGKTAEEVGFSFKLVSLPETISQSELISEIKKLNNLEHMSGLIVQLPLPESIDKQAVLNAIDPRIDVDCLGEVNSKLFYENSPYLLPPTAAAIIKILDSIKIDLTNKKILVVGQGQLVGKPVDFILRSRGLKTVVADRQTKDLAALTISADVIISATGKPNLITSEMVKEGSVVIDAGTAEMDGGIVGDVDTGQVSRKTLWISPVPGGVGPVTVAMLLKNVFSVARDSYSDVSRKK